MFGEVSGAQLIVPPRDQLFRGLDRHCCVAAIGIRTDRLAEFLVQRRPPTSTI